MTLPDAPAAPTDVPSQEERFANHLYGLSQQAPTDGTTRARLARLRGSLGRREVDLLAFRDIGEALPSGISEHARETYLLVAALYALHASKSDKPWYGGFTSKTNTFGASCGRLRGGAGSMDLRFAALLDARREDLPHRLRQAVSLLAASKNGVGVRYELLLRDLLAWNTPGRPVQRAWAAAYWTPASRPAPSL